MRATYREKDLSAGREDHFFYQPIVPICWTIIIAHLISFCRLSARFSMQDFTNMFNGLLMVELLMQDFQNF